MRKVSEQTNEHTYVQTNEWTKRIRAREQKNKREREREIRRENHKGKESESVRDRVLVEVIATATPAARTVAEFIAYKYTHLYIYSDTIYVYFIFFVSQQKFCYIVIDWLKKFHHGEANDRCW